MRGRPRSPHRIGVLPDPAGMRGRRTAGAVLGALARAHGIGADRVAEMLAETGLAQGPGRLAVTGMTAERVGALATEHGIVILELDTRRPTLEEVPGELCAASRTVSAESGPEGGR
ncbi:hypothetical protein [Streptomyces sp. DSM 40907]|uniref:hypothetical protein n=1 Tax=Streptomyces kutzneri TaxID=3051179 RepID=UPI0028D8397D|nr:hypothetical protein [Streptomyces sp. DSM 40907]